jgi:DnaK suppressor protein
VDKSRARELLARERARTEAQLARLREREAADELTQVDQHPADFATELFDDELGQSLAISLEEKLAAIERAERRLDDSTYGLSVESGEPIADERLELVPWAERTAAEQARLERSR